jgi:hypothetical protein
MKKHITLAVLFLAPLAALHAQTSAPERPVKKLIEYGWDVPYPDQVRKDIRNMEKTPFDGIISARVQRHDAGRIIRVAGHPVPVGEVTDAYDYLTTTDHPSTLRELIVMKTEMDPKIRTS